MSECECPIAGFCKRHNASKSQRDWELCQGVNCTPHVAAKYRRFWDERAAGEIVVRTHTELSERVVAPPKVFDPIPRDQWPAAANLVAMLATPEDTGIGDTIKRQLGTAGQLYQAAFRAITGGSCAGCGFRQRKWNQLYPY